MRRLPLFLVLAALAAPGSVRAGLGPELTAEAGSTFAVLGDPGDGGFSASLSALWPVPQELPVIDRLRFGVTGFADDLGTNLGRLRDPNDPSLDLGAVEEGHRLVWGGGWRLDATMGAWHGWSPTALASWGAYRLHDDVRGKVKHALSSTGFGLGLGAEHAFSPRHAFGIGLRYHRLFNDVAGRYVTGGVTWRWGRGD